VSRDLPSPPRAIPVDAFLQVLLRSRLMGRVRLDEILGTVPPQTRQSAQELADYLIASGDLTHYQAEKLQQGLWQGLVLGRYQVLAPLGRGGMGTVYLARDTGAAGPASSSLVALKVLPPKRAQAEEKTLLRFRREMELGRHLAHPNITRTFDAGEIGGVHYIAMEYVPGASLRQVVARGGPLPVGDVARLFVDVAEGLAHAHARNLIHRDLKPSNIMVTPEGRAKILDLGMAILVGEVLPDDPTIVGGEGYILGTMDYIAPEQSADSTDVGPRSDLYSLGCSMYFALTGVPPFPGGTSQQKMKWHRESAAPSVSALNPAVRPEFSRIVEQLMSKSPGERPASAGVVRGLLVPGAAEAVSRAVEGPHSAGEAFAQIDRRTFDPSLWDVAPMPAAADSAPARLQAPEIDAEPNEPVIHSLAFTVLAIGLVLALVALAVVLVLLRRL
jgi:serine/threonine protein kinase